MVDPHRIVREDEGFSLPSSHSPLRLSAAKQLQSDWKDCLECHIGFNRKAFKQKVVLWRGEVPSEVLYISDPPTIVEAELGLPLLGQSGQLLDDIHTQAICGYSITKCITSCIGCVPTDGQISDSCVYACSGRLLAICQLCNPDVIVCCGEKSFKLVNQVITRSNYEREEKKDPEERSWAETSTFSGKKGYVQLPTPAPASLPFPEIIRISSPFSYAFLGEKDFAARFAKDSVAVKDALSKIFHFVSPVEPPKSTLNIASLSKRMKK